MRRWLFDPAATRAWWLDDAGTRVIAWRGELAHDLATLPRPARSLVRLGDALLAIGDGDPVRVELVDGTTTCVPLPTSSRPSADAHVIGLGPSSFAWVEPGGLTLRMFELRVGVGCAWWPTEPRVAHHGPRLAVDGEYRRLAWCHVVDAIDVVDLEHGGRPQALGARPEHAPVGAPALHAHFAQGLWLDRGGRRVAAAHVDARGLQLVIRACTPGTDTAPERIELGSRDAQVLVVDVDRRIAIVGNGTVVERVELDGDRHLISHGLGTVVAAQMHDAALGLGDDAGDCAWIEEAPA